MPWFSVFVAILFAVSRGERDLEEGFFEVADSDSKEDVSTFVDEDKEVDFVTLLSRDNVKSYTDETASISENERGNRTRYRFKNRRQPHDDEYMSASGYKMRSRPDDGNTQYDENVRLADSDDRLNPEGGKRRRRPDNRDRRKPDGSGRRRRPGRKDRRKPNGGGKRRRPGQGDRQQWMSETDGGGRKRRPGYENRRQLAGRGRKRRPGYEDRRRADDNNYEDRGNLDDNENEDGENLDDNDFEDSGNLDDNDNEDSGSSNFNDASCRTCGMMIAGRRVDQPSFNNLVINGRIVQPMFKYPWIVSLSLAMTGKVFCGGAIISATFVLTAGHCVVNPQKSKSPRCGGQNIPRGCFFGPNQVLINLLEQSQGVRQRQMQIAQIIPHGRYDNTKVLHDIALIQLAAPLRCDQLTSPICLPTADFQRLGGNLIIAGWGIFTEDLRQEPVLLREGIMKQVPGEVCQRFSRPFFNRLEDVVCGIGTESGQSSCMGDSGTSIFAPFRNKIYTIGISSRHSMKNCQTNMPVTYSKVFRYINWIRLHVRDLPS